MLIITITKMQVEYFEPEMFHLFLLLMLSVFANYIYETLITAEKNSTQIY